jgi:hypothetical protein
MDAAELLRRKQPTTREVEILLDQSYVEQRAELAKEIRRVERAETWDGGDLKSPLPRLRSELEALDATIRAETVTIRFTALPRRRWLELVELHMADGDEPTEEFAKAIVLESAVEPKFSTDDVDQIWESWSSAETDELFIAAWRVNREVRDIPFISGGTGETPSIASNSTTAQSEE